MILKLLQSTGNLSLFCGSFPAKKKEKKKQTNKQTRTAAKLTERRTRYYHLSIITKQPQSTLYVCYACELHEPRNYYQDRNQITLQR